MLLNNLIQAAPNKVASSPNLHTMKKSPFSHGKRNLINNFETAGQWLRHSISPREACILNDAAKLRICLQLLSIMKLLIFP